MKKACVPLCIFFLFLLYSFSCGPGAKDVPTYMNSALSFQQRAADLVSEMTLDEKIAPMQSEAFAVPRLGIENYNSLNDLPSFFDYAMKGRTYRYYNGRPLYPFGYGLSSSTFGNSNLKLSRASSREGDSVQMSVNIANRGEYDGDEVVQLYVRNMTSQEPQPRKSLAGFKRVHIRKRETLTVPIPLAAAQLRYFSEKSDRFVLDRGTYEIQVGASAEDIRVKTTVRVE